MINFEFCKEKIINLYLGGKTLKEVGIEFGCSDATIRRRLTEWRINIRHRGATKEWLDSIRDKAIIERKKNPPKGSLNGRWKGGKVYYFKQEVLARDGRVCQICGYKEHPEIIEVHHIDGNHHNNVLENGMAVCPNCHRIKEFSNGTFHTKLRSKRYE